MNKKKALVTLKYIIISSIDLEIYKTVETSKFVFFDNRKVHRLIGRVIFNFVVVIEKTYNCTKKASK